MSSSLNYWVIKTTKNTAYINIRSTNQFKQVGVHEKNDIFGVGQKLHKITHNSMKKVAPPFFNKLISRGAPKEHPHKIWSKCVQRF